VNKNLKKNKGFGLVEIILGASILTVGILALIISYTTYVKFALSNQKNVQAAYLLEEGIEAVTILRDKGWTANIATLSTTTTYYLSWNGSHFATTTTAQYVDGQFLRSVGISDVKRDGSDRIATAGTWDPNTKKITATVSYFQGHATTTKSIASYISNIYSN